MLKRFVRVRLWEPYAINVKKLKIVGHHALSEIRCVVDRAKLPNLANVAVIGFVYFWRKPFDHWKEDAVMKFNVNGSI